MDVDQNRTERGSVYGAAPCTGRARGTHCGGGPLEAQAAKIQAALHAMHCVIGATVLRPSLRFGLVSHPETEEPKKGD